MDKIWYLQQIDLFRGINEKEIMKFATKVAERTCKKGQVIYTPSEIRDSICILKKGEVKLYHSHYGKKLIIETLKPGSIFGNINFEEGKTNHFAEASEEAKVCFFSIEDFMKVIQAKPEITVKLLKIMAKRVKEYEQLIKHGLLDAREKIIHHLEIQERKNNSLMCMITGKKHLTHEEIAEHVGLSRETVTRAIKSLKKEKRIYSDKLGRIFISK